jgi:hypothetical protein
MKRSSSLRRFVATLIMAAATAGLLTIATPAAADSTDTAVPVGATKSAMYLDCAALSASALELAGQRGLCRSYADGGVGTQDLRFDTCGWSWIFVYNEGGGTARFEYGFVTTLGTAVRRNLVISVITTGWGTGIGDSNWMFSASYSNAKRYHTGPGSVIGGLSGTVLLVTGFVCQLTNPTDSETIT